MRACCSLLLLALVTCGALGCGASAPTPASGPRLLLEFPALDGGTIELARYTGRPVVLHVFAAWDPNSQADIELLEEVFEKDSTRVHVIGLALDPGGFDIVAPFRKALGARYLIGLATDEIRAGQTPLGNVKQVPTTFVLDCRGRKMGQLSGRLRREELDRAVASALARC